LRIVAITVTLPDRVPLVLTHLIADVNGTLTDRGRLIDGVADRISRLRELLEVHLLTADTYGTLPDIAAELGGVTAQRVRSGAEKAAVARRLTAETCAAVGNGRNDEPVLRAVALGIAVIGPEGASPHALAAADVVCTSVTSALDLLLDPRALAATLRP
jgi:soluble P-type ATPase